MTEFEKYILENHPDPDILTIDLRVFDQMCRLATKFAEHKVNVALGSVSKCTICDTEINYNGICETCYTKEGTTAC